MRVADRRADVENESDASVHVELVMIRGCGDRQPVDQLHDEERRMAVRPIVHHTRIVEARDVRVLQQGEGAPLAVELSGDDAARAAKHLEGDRSVDAPVGTFGAVDHTSTAFAKQPCHAPRADLLRENLLVPRAEPSHRGDQCTGRICCVGRGKESCRRLPKGHVELAILIGAGTVEEGCTLPRRQLEGVRDQVGETGPCGFSHAPLEPRKR